MVIMASDKEGRYLCVRQFRQRSREEKCRRAAEQSLDGTEFLHVRKYSADEIEKMIEKGEFQQAIHIMDWLLVRRRGTGGHKNA
ncbi:hypothetical protein AMURIS_00342 [Acetatifactor muris]|uniref:Uncharacterized protein n=2 Tax=Acetatifactor muris TaxID=879566 RepID=A0A2K4ZAZ7_9FIRM|nr:hypothetical protein AMURIS_00342 [Acetatifactor muris]